MAFYISHCTLSLSLSLCSIKSKAVVVGRWSDMQNPLLRLWLLRTVKMWRLCVELHHGHCGGTLHHLPMQGFLIEQVGVQRKLLLRMVPATAMMVVRMVVVLMRRKLRAKRSLHSQ